MYRQPHKYELQQKGSTGMNDDDDKEFERAGDLEDWLKSRGVNPRKATEAATELFRSGYDMPSTLLGITVGELLETRISRPIARHLSNKLKDPQHQQQQQEENEEANTQQQIANRSLNIRKAWSERLRNLPTIAELTNVVQAELPVPLPSPYTASGSTLDLPVTDVLAFTNQDATLAPNLGNIQSSIYSLSIFGDNEDSVHSLVDRMVLDPMKVVGEGANCDFLVNRNGTDSSGATIRNLRPDVLLWLPSGVLAFKGEDKATASDRNIARNELVKKLSSFSDTFFGRVPYQLCYNAGGTRLEFVAIYRNPGARPSLHGVSPVIDLSTVRGRSLCVRYAVNIARILVSMQETYPDGNVIRLGGTIHTTNSTVHIMGDYAIKRAKKHSGSILKELYAAIRRSNAPFIASSLNDVKINRLNVLTVHITPVGFCGRTPASDLETRNAGCNLLQAIKWLHDNGWVHRDIRPSNILCSGGRWYLMDLEWANMIDKEFGDYSPSPDFLPPEVVGIDGAIWTAACDMWQFGRLIECWSKPAASSYVRIQTSKNPGDRLTADQSLQHGLFV